MSIPQSLAVEFALSPGQIEKLGEDDEAFSDLACAFCEIDKRIHRIETLIEPASADVLGELKRHRALIRAEIAAAVSSWALTPAPAAVGRAG